jgi:carbon storage regulator CsrA
VGEPLNDERVRLDRPRGDAAPDERSPPMLVLSRRLNEKLLFPTFHAAVEILGIKGNTVRLGIQAPPEVKVLREEIPDRQAEWAAPALAPAPDAHADRAQLTRLVDKRLQVAGIGLGVLRGQIQAGSAEDALAIVEALAEDLQMLRRRLADEGNTATPPPARAVRKAKKALLVEDNANERELLARFLRMGGFDVDTAGDGADALDYLRARGKPDVLLLDMGLPRCDGPTTLREIRRDRALDGLKVVAVSGHMPEEYNLGRGPGGIDRWFCKPIDPAELIRDLERDLDPSRAV